jgi:putative tricarboxylic transport membrane protein
MNKHDRMSAFFFVVLATAICVESIRLGPGSFSNPGPGLLPLGCGLFLGFLGIVEVAVSMKGFHGGQTLLWNPGTRWRCLIFIPVSLIAYAFLLDILGFHLVTFFWTGFMCRGVGRMGWRSTLITSVATTFFSYLLFEYFLSVQFPKGIVKV